jgi:replicative DNA helicase
VNDSFETATAEEPGRDVAAPPQNLDAERAVLGAMLLDPDALSDSLYRLKDEDFYRESHRIIFEVFRHFADAGEPVEELQVRAELERRGDLDRIGGPEYIRELVYDVTSAAFLHAHINLMKACAQKRDLINACKEALEGCYYAEPVATVFDSLEGKLDAIRQHKSTGAVSMSNIIGDVVEELSGDCLEGVVYTGQPEIDRYLGGLKPGELIILGARPSMGKTSLALNIVEYICRTTGVLMFSLEMTKEQIARNLICLVGSVNSEHMMEGKFSERDREGIAEAHDKLAQMPLSIIDSADINTGRLRAAVRAQVKRGVSLIVVDYIQLMKAEGPRDSIREAMVKVTRGLKSLAKSCNVPVLALSQITRLAEDRPPKLSDLKESGSIEEDADKVILLHREDRRSEIAHANIAKNRSGRTGSALLDFQGEFFRFTS